MCLFAVGAVPLTILVIFTQTGLQEERDIKPVLQKELNVQFLSQSFSEAIVGALCLVALQSKVRKAPNKILGIILLALGGLTMALASMSFSSNVMNRFSVISNIGANLAESASNGLSSWTDRVMYGATFVQVWLAMTSYNEMSSNETAKLCKEEEDIQRNR
jgi:hypothetical protein